MTTLFVATYRRTVIHVEATTADEARSVAYSRLFQIYSRTSDIPENRYDFRLDEVAR